MEHTQSIDIQEYKAVVQAYILEKTGKKVTIVFDDLMRFNLDFKMLCHAYDIAIAYYKNKN